MWAGVFIGLVGAMWGKRPFTQIAIPIALFLYSIYELTFLMLYAHPLTQWQNWPTKSLFYIIITLFAAWGLNHSHARHYLIDNE